MIRSLIALAAVVTALVAGVYIGAHPNTPIVGQLKDLIAPDQVEISTNDVRSLIENEFYRPVSEEKLTNASIRGMVHSLKDPYTHYFDAEQNKAFTESISGHYSGVGMAVQDDKRGLVITHVYDGTPAQRARLKPEDVITEVNGKSIAGQPADAAVARVKGREGTTVKLTVRSPRRSGSRKLGAPRVITLKRKSIETPIATGEIVREGGRKVGVIELAVFAETAGQIVGREVTKLKRRGAGSFVLDLRGNGGGRLDQAVAVSSVFVPKGLIVATDGRSRRRREYDANKGALLTAAPLVVLVDRGSASASEIVAGALKFRDRALVVGTRTYGKGVFQEVTEFDNGGALSLTVGRYLLPGDRKITSKGLAPDLKVEDNPHTRRDEALNAAIAALAEFKK